jgi:YD repeat-containing protein
MRRASSSSPETVARRRLPLVLSAAVGVALCLAVLAALGLLTVGSADAASRPGVGWRFATFPQNANSTRVSLGVVTGTITPDGTPVGVTIANSGDTAAITFTETAGHRVSLNITNHTGAISDVAIKDPSNTTVASTTIVGSSKFIEPTGSLSTTGTYTITVVPWSNGTTSLTLSLYDVPADVTGPIAIGGAPVRISLTAPGQNASLAFDGVQGQQVRLYRSEITIPTSVVKILKPDGSVLVSSGAIGTPDNSDTATLPITSDSSSGTYHVVVDGFDANIGAMTLTLAVNGDSPVNAAQIQECGTTSIPFRAEPSPGASWYQFQIASDSAFTSIVDDSGTLPSTNTYTPPAGKLATGTTLYWRWRSSNTSYTAARSFNSGLAMHGIDGSRPAWSAGPLAVNEVNGNLVATLPGPSFPAIGNAMGASLSYNSLDTNNRGLSAGWTLAAGDLGGDPPVKLVNHNLLVGSDQFDGIELFYGDGSSACYSHVGQTNTYVAEPGDGSQLSRNADGSFTLLDQDGTISSFGIPSGATGLATLTSVERVDAAPGKGKLTFQYSAQDPSKIVSVTDESSRSLSLTWNSLNPSGCANALLCITGPDGVTWRYIGDGTGGTSGRLAKINDGARDLAAVGYDASGRVNKLQNANDLDPTHASPGYDSTHSLGVTYDGSGRVASVTDGPITGQSPSSSTWSFDYHPGSVSTTATRSAHDGLPSGTARTAAGYTLLTPPRQQGQPSPTKVKSFYDGFGHTMEVDDQLGNATMASYNAQDQLLWSEDADGNPTDYSYDPVDNELLSATGADPDGAGGLPAPVTGYRYDETQIGTKTTPGAALGGLRGAYFDNVNLAGRPKALATDATVDFNYGSGGPTALPGVSDNFSVRWSGDLNVQTIGLFTFSTVSDEGTRLTIDGYQLINNWHDQTVTTTTSNQVTLGPGLHKLVLEYYDKTGPAEVHLRWACPAPGCSQPISDQVIPSSALRPAYLNQTSTLAPASPQSLGRIVFNHYADPIAGQPDYTLVQPVSGTNLITSYSYDNYGRLAQWVMPKGNASRTIDSQGNLTGGPDTTFATTYSYYAASGTAAPPTACGGGSAVNQAGQLKELTPHGITTTTTVYDAAGRPVAVTKAAGTTCHNYDNEGRVTSEKAPGDSQTTTYTYDPVGVLRTATDASGTITSEYDEAGRLKRSVDSFGAEATYAYDSEDNLTQRIAATGALGSSTNYTTSYSYSDRDELTGLTDPAGRAYSFYYDKRGNLKASQYPNGTFAWNEINPDGWLTNLYNRHGTLSNPLPASVPSDASPIADYAYTYNADGQRTQEVRTGGGPHHRDEQLQLRQPRPPHRRHPALRRATALRLRPRLQPHPDH